MGGRWGKHEDRDGELFHLYFIQKWPQTKIAEHLGISQPTVSNLLTRIKAEMPPIDKERMLAESVELINYTREKLIAIVEMQAAPVFVGKDGDIARDENGAVVRDYSAHMAALKLALTADDTLARRLGLDSPTKTDVTSTVRYTLEGVDTGDLS